MRLFFIVVFAALGLSACKTQHVYVPEDAGPECEDNLELVNGTCMFVCHRDGDCMASEHCNLFTGQCEMKPPPVDAGPTPDLCTTGATRCTMDKKAIETCQADATWMTTTTCPAGGFCQDDKCLACQPGVATCDPMDMTKLDVCKDDGSGLNVITCAAPATCQSNECRACSPNAYRCSPDGKSLQQCTKGSDPTQTWSWTNIGDNFDGTCITGQCVVGGPDGYQCVAPQCFPGQIQCKDVSTAQTCGMTGSWVDAPCVGAAQCTAGVCVDECADAVAAKSYFGCEYWTAVNDNSVDTLFKGGAATGQGTQDLQFAFVVTNRSISPATVTVQRYFGGSVQTVKTVMVPGRQDAATKGLMTILVPWQSISPASNPVGVSNSGLARYGYHLTSTKPLTVYQFNPISGFLFTNKSCAVPSSSANPFDCTCDEYSDFNSQMQNLLLCNIDPYTYGFDPGLCAAEPGMGNRCKYNAYSNDASLLLPAHILGTSHVVVTDEHTVVGHGGGSNSITQLDADNTGYVTIVGTADGTTVTVKSSAVTRDGGTAVPALNKGDTKMFTLNSYDVLQIASNNIGTTTLECSPDPFNPGSIYKVCRQDNDLTGTVITSTAPVAVFGGSPCTTKPYNRPACDHAEEQIFPFSTWGKSFVAIKSAPYLLANGNGWGNPLPDMYKIVSGCPTSQCPNGTNITITPSSAVSQVLLPTTHCAAGSNLATGTCKLMGVTDVQFTSGTNFKIDSDQPIAVAQFYVGEGQPTGASTDVAQGDPSMVLLPPVEQWRADYTVLAGPTFASNYLSLAIDTTKVDHVTVDGTTVTGIIGVSGTTFAIKNVSVAGGTHTVSVIPKAGQTVVPGAGVVVYGYDAFVSYGYTGGLDLQSIVTGINPGG